MSAYSTDVWSREADWSPVSRIPCPEGGQANDYFIHGDGFNLTKAGAAGVGDGGEKAAGTNSNNESRA